jgi:hypothetical protein
MLFFSTKLQQPLDTTKGFTIFYLMVCQAREMDKRREGRPGDARAALRRSVRENGFVFVSESCSCLSLILKLMLFLFLIIHTFILWM